MSKNPPQRIVQGRKATNKEKRHFQELLDEAKIPPDMPWHYLLVGDGSGSTWDRAAGWGCLSATRHAGELVVQDWHGACNRGTNNFAELMAYVHPLSALICESNEGIRSFKTIHIFTDSEYIKNTGNAMNAGKTPDKHSILWDVVRLARRHSYLLNWHWTPRAKNMLNRYADHLSRRSRLALEAADVPEAMAKEGIFPGTAPA